MIKKSVKLFKSGPAHNRSYLAHNKSLLSSTSKMHNPYISFLLLIILFLVLARGSLQL